jgi:hypothetical protein
LPAPGAPQPAGSPGWPELQQFLHDFAADLKTGTTPIIRDRALATMLAVTVLFLAGNGALTALLIPYISVDLSGNAGTVGILFSALGAGYLLSAYAGKNACASPHLRQNAHHGRRHRGDLRRVLTQRLAPDEIIGRVSAAYSTAENAATQ